ncbi:MAG: RNA polymerase sigma factor [Solirubrobacteraceae bacterium]
MPQRDFAGIYNEHVWRVYGFFAYWVRSRQDAEDLTQVTFERALRAWERYDATRASVSTWLLTIARNLLIDHMRASKSDRHQPADEATLEALAASADRPDLGLDPDLERALGQLGSRERELIALRFGADLTGPEIARLTGLSLSNVQQILSRSLRRMRTSLDGSHLHEIRGAGAASAVEAGSRSQGSR